MPAAPPAATVTAVPRPMWCRLSAFCTFSKYSSFSFTLASSFFCSSISSDCLESNQIKRQTATRTPLGITRHKFDEQS